MDPSLYMAATRGNVKSLRKLLEMGNNVLNSTTTPELNTALHIAALHGHAPFACEVLKVREEMLAARNKDGDTPLHLAARKGKLKVAALLVGLKQQRPQDLSTEGGTSFKGPLIMRNIAGNTPLHEAVLHRRSTVAVMLLDADPCRGHDLNRWKESPLNMAARVGLVDVVRKIVDLPPVPGQIVPRVDGTSLRHAVLGGHTRIVKVLVEKWPAIIEQTDSFANNALHHAARKNHSQVVELLLNKYPSLANQLNAELRTPLHIAALNGSTDVIKTLLRHCPDAADKVDSHDRNAFHISVAGGKADALRCLLRRVRPAELLNRADSDGNTPLHLAILMRQFQCALMLLDDHRVDPFVRNRDGHTARTLMEAKFSNTAMNPYEAYLRNKLGEAELIRRFNRRPLSDKDFDNVVDPYFLAATLIATVTFAATFTMPGGYDQTSGITLHAHSTAFRTFVVSNTVAMCSSIVVIFLIIWARQEPVKLRLHTLFWSQILTIIACLAMLVSLMTTVYITVAPKAPWPAYAVIAIATSTPAVFFFITWAGKRSMSSAATNFDINL